MNSIKKNNKIPYLSHSGIMDEQKGFPQLNLLWPHHHAMALMNSSTLIRVMGLGQIGAEPLPERIETYCQ